MTQSSHPQPESPPPTPFFRLMFRLGGTWILFFLPIAAIAWGAGFVNSRDAARLDRDGVETEGRLWSEGLGYGRRDENNRPTYSIRTNIEFEDEKGETFRSSNTHQVSSRPSTSITARRPIRIRYYRNDPSVFEAGQIGAKARYARNGNNLALACLAAAAGLFLWKGRRALRAMRVRDQGRRLRVNVRRPPAEAKDLDYRKLHWKTDEGLLGKSLPFPRKRALLKPGTAIRVFTDGKESWWEGDVGSPKIR